MNEEKIKELEAQIKALKEEKPRTDREILESIEKLLKELVSKPKDPFRDVVFNAPSMQPINPLPISPNYTWDVFGKPDLERDPDFYNRQRRFREFLNS